MTKRIRRTFSPEFKFEAPQLVVVQGYSMVEAAKAMNVSKSALDKWVRLLKQEIQGIPPKAALLTPEQIEIRELKKQNSEQEEHNEIIKMLQLC